MKAPRNAEIRARARLRVKTKTVRGVTMTSFSSAELRRALHDTTVEKAIRQKLYAWMLSRQKRLPTMPHKKKSRAALPAAFAVEYEARIRIGRTE